MNRKKANLKILIIGFLVVVIFSALLINVYAVTILGIHYRSKTDIRLYSGDANTITTVKQANRGKIFDCNGNIIAQDIETYTIYAILDSSRPNASNKPAYVQDIDYTAQVLAPILNMSEESLITYLSKDNYQVEFGAFGRNLSLATKEEIESYDLPGIEFTKTISRNYPLGIFASHIIGFAQFDDTLSALVGKMGIENIYNKELTGVNGYIKYQVNKSGYTLPDGLIKEVDAIDGDDIYLTLDRNIQETLEMSLAETMTTKSAEKAFGAVMEVETGKILAWGGYPTFDPSDLDIEDYTNLGTQYAYEPGSTMKTFTYAAAIDTGVYDGDATFNSATFYMGIKNGKAIRVSDINDAIEKISNSRYKSWGYISYDTGYKYSSNVGIASLLTEYLDPSVFEEYLDKFGFFNKVGFDGFTEVAGVKNFNYPIEKIALGYGQGSSVTMVQMLQAFSAIFNDGTMIKPYIVQQIKNAASGESEYLASTTIVGTPIKESTAKQVQDLMYQVVNASDGSGKHYQVSEVEVLGKTGTAQYFENGSYSTSKVITSVVLAFPADDPKIMVYYAFLSDYNEYLHANTEPITNLVKKIAVNYGLTTTTETDVVDTTEYYDVDTYTMPSLVNHTMEYALYKLKDMTLNIIMLGNGDQIIDQYPNDSETLITNQSVLLLTNDDQILMPNVIGFSRKEIAALWDMTKIAVTIDGYGLVSAQSINEGSLLYPNSELTVTLTE